MSSLSPECDSFKSEYDACFNKWYSERFLHFRDLNNPCQELFEKYKSCVWKAIKEKKIDTLIVEAEKEIHELRETKST